MAARAPRNEPPDRPSLAVFSGPRGWRSRLRCALEVGGEVPDVVAGVLHCTVAAAVGLILRFGDRNSPSLKSSLVYGVTVFPIQVEHRGHG